MVSLDTENTHRLRTAIRSILQCFFGGSTVRPKRRLMSSMLEDLEGFRAKYEIIGSVADGLTWTPKGLALELEVAPGIMKALGWRLCLSYGQNVREAPMDLIRLQGLLLVEALDRVRNGQEHRMIHWVQLLMQREHQRALSASASSSGSSSSAKRSNAAQPANQSLQSRQASIYSETSCGQILFGRKGKDRSRSPKPVKSQW